MLSVSLRKTKIIRRRDFKIIWKCVYPRHYTRNTGVSVGTDWWDCFSARESLVWWYMKQGSLIVGSPPYPWWSSPPHSSWGWSWRCTPMSLTCTSTPVSYNWKVKTCCFSKWHCKPTTRLPQMFSCRWIPAGPLRADTQMMQSKASCFRMGLWTILFTAKLDFKCLFKALFDTVLHQNQTTSGHFLN